jgi:hypothetical protein
MQEKGKGPVRVKDTIRLEQGKTATLIVTGKNLDLINKIDVAGGKRGGLTTKVISSSQTTRKLSLTAHEGGTYQVKLRAGTSVVKTVSVKIDAQEKVYRTAKKPAVPVPSTKPEMKKPPVKKAKPAPAQKPPVAETAPTKVAKPSPKPLPSPAKSEAKKPFPKPAAAKPGTVPVQKKKTKVATKLKPQTEAERKPAPKAQPAKPAKRKDITAQTKKPAKAAPKKPAGEKEVKRTEKTVPAPPKKKPGKVAAKTTPGPGNKIETQTRTVKPTPGPAPKKGKTTPAATPPAKTTVGKTDQAGIIFVSRVSPKSSPAGKGSTNTIVVTGRNLSGVTSARIIGKDRRTRTVKIISKKDGEIALAKPPDMKTGTYQIQLYSGNEPVQVAQHIARFQVKAPPPPTTPPPPAPGQLPYVPTHTQALRAVNDKIEGQINTVGSSVENMEDALSELENLKEGHTDAKPSGSSQRKPAERNEIEKPRSVEAGSTLTVPSLNQEQDGGSGGLTAPERSADDFSSSLEASQGTGSNASSSALLSEFLKLQARDTSISSSAAASDSCAVLQEEMIALQQQIDSLTEQMNSLQPPPEQIEDIDGKLIANPAFSNYENQVQMFENQIALLQERYSKAVVGLEKCQQRLRANQSQQQADQAEIQAKEAEIRESIIEESIENANSQTDAEREVLAQTMATIKEHQEMEEDAIGRIVGGTRETTASEQSQEQADQSPGTSEEVSNDPVNISEIRGKGPRSSDDNISSSALQHGEFSIYEDESPSGSDISTIYQPEGRVTSEDVGSRIASLGGDNARRLEGTETSIFKGAPRIPTGEGKPGADLSPDAQSTATTSDPCFEIEEIMRHLSQQIDNLTVQIAILTGKINSLQPPAKPKDDDLESQAKYNQAMNRYHQELLQYKMQKGSLSSQRAELQKEYEEKKSQLLSCRYSQTKDNETNIKEHSGPLEAGSIERETAVSIEPRNDHDPCAELEEKQKRLSETISRYSNDTGSSDDTGSGVLTPEESAQAAEAEAERNKQLIEFLHELRSVEAQLESCRNPTATTKRQPVYVRERREHTVISDIMKTEQGDQSSGTSKGSQPAQTISTATKVTIKKRIKQWNEDKPLLLESLNKIGRDSRHKPTVLKFHNELDSVDKTLKEAERVVEQQVQDIGKIDSVITRLERHRQKMRNLQDEIKQVEQEQEKVRNKRQIATTAFQNFDQKANQLFNLLSSVMKAMNEMRMGTVRNML